MLIIMFMHTVHTWQSSLHFRVIVISCDQKLFTGIIFRFNTSTSAIRLPQEDISVHGTMSRVREAIAQEK